MPQTKKQIEALLAAAGTEPKHRFGQNFMIDQNLVRLVADAGRVEFGDWVIEVGPGTGTLTEELLSRGARVIAVEIDRDLSATLRDRFADQDQFELIEGDALATKHLLNETLLLKIAQGQQAEPAARVKLIANLPYNIASPLVIELLLAGVEVLAFTVQKEVADRLKAGAGDEAYGPLSVVVQLLGDVEVLRTLPPQAFWPAPKIESALVRITRKPPSAAGVDPRDLGASERFRERSRGFAPAADERPRALGAFVHAVFCYRRKTLRKALSQAGFDSVVILDATQFDGQLRPEQFTPAQFAAMFAAATPLRL